MAPDTCWTVAAVHFSFAELVIRSSLNLYADDVRLILLAFPPGVRKSENPCRCAVHSYLCPVMHRNDPVY